MSDEDLKKIGPVLKKSVNDLLLRNLIIKFSETGFTVAELVVMGFDEAFVKDCLWNYYMTFLNNWVDSHDTAESFGMSPPCYTEWYYNELLTGRNENGN